MSAFPVPDRVPGWRMLAFAAVLLSGCSTTEIDKIPHEIGGLPAGAPARPVEAPAYPAVHDMPPQRALLLDAEQQKRLEADLIAVRNRQPNQQKNIAREKAKAEQAAKAKAAEEAKEARMRRRKSGMPPEAASGTPPWPVPLQTTGGSARP